MILQREIQKISEAQNLPKTTIDKDWVLGHFLSSIFSQSKLQNALVFKGGTCLKKCYFHDYRFSEDLDFTSLNSDFILESSHIKDICKQLEESHGIHTSIRDISPMKYEDRIMGYKSIIAFWGADHSKNQSPPETERWTTSVKIEISTQEIIEFPFETKTINHPYSDELSIKSVKCYSLNEVITEKLRSLIQRSYTAPRDYYDLWHLFNNVDNLDFVKIKKSFLKKMSHKGLVFTDINQMINERNDKVVKAAWDNSLRHQIKAKNLPDYFIVRDKLKQQLDFLS